MTYNPDIHHRRSIRLKGYDYTKAGAYFVTLCTQNKVCFFGEVFDGAITLNAAGQMIDAVWHEIPKFYPGIKIDVFQIMPNHIHGILVFVGAGPCACPDSEPGSSVLKKGPKIAKKTEPGQEPGQAQGPAPTLSVSDVVHRFKTMTTKKYIDGVKNDNWSSFDQKLWQRNYYEHIIRNEGEWHKVREYITSNPMKWETDQAYSNVSPAIKHIKSWE